MDAYPNLKLIYMLLLPRTLLFLIACSTHPIVTLQLSGMQDHMVWATNSAYTKPCIYLLEPGALNIPKICNHTQPINCHMIPEKDTMVSYMTQTRHHLNNQALAVFFPSSTKPATLRYSKSIDKYSPQHVSWLFSWYFMTNIIFWPSFPRLPPFLNFTANSMHYLVIFLENYPQVFTNIFWSLVDNSSY